MQYAYCWHRPGRVILNARLCKHCGVAIEECPGVENRQACRGGKDCSCEGSGWLGTIRSKRSLLEQTIDFASEAATSAAGRSQLKE